MNTAITRIGFLLIPAALALALAPAAAMADELQNGASSINSSHTEQTQEPLAGEASIGNDSTPKNESSEKAAETTTPGSPSNTSSSEPAVAPRILKTATTTAQTGFSSIQASTNPCLTKR